MARQLRGAGLSPFARSLPLWPSVVTLRKRKDIVMIDNLPAHKAAGVREAIEAAVRCFAICPNTRRT